MGRVTDFSDKTIKKGFGPDKDKKLTVKTGQKLIVRVVTKLEEYLSHAVHDVLPPKRDEKTGANVPSIFNMSCARKWDEKAGDYVGECRGHDKDYDFNERYVGGVMVLGMLQGQTVIPYAPADSGKFWDMTAGRVAELREVIATEFPQLEGSQIGDQLRKTTLVLGLKNEGGAEFFQKLVIGVWKGTQIPITEEHKSAYRLEIPAIIKEVAAPATLEEQDRRLKRKVNQTAPAAAGQAAEQGEANLDDLDLDGTAPAAPAPAAKPRATRAPAAAAKAAPKAAPAPAAVEDDLGDLGEPAAEEAPAEEAPAPPPRKAAPAAAKKTAVAATATATKKVSDEVVADMLDGLEGIG